MVTRTVEYCCGANPAVAVDSSTGHLVFRCVVRGRGERKKRRVVLKGYTALRKYECALREKERPDGPYDNKINAKHAAYRMYRSIKRAVLYVTHRRPAATHVTSYLRNDQ